MAQSLACPTCQTKLFAPPDVFGQSVRCTKCGGTFIASAVHSPYLEGLPPAPKNYRPAILGGAILVGLLLVTWLVLGVNGFDEEPGKDAGSGKLADSKNAQVAIDSIRPKPTPKMYTATGVPIEIAEGDGPDRLPPPGAEEPRPRTKSGENAPAPAKKKPTTLDDVTIISLKWDVALNLRQLNVSYSFQNGASPSNGYTLKVKLDDGPAVGVPVDLTWPDSGVKSLNVQPSISERPGRLPKAEVWIERTYGGGLEKKASNTVSTE